MLDSVLLSIAKSAILSHFEKNITIDKDTLFDKYPYLANNGAVFVTLHHKGDLRGCIGSIIAYTTLFEDIIHNAFSAAFRDPRFSSLKKDEFSNISLEVSLLSEPKLLEYEDFDDLLGKIRPNIDGLILKHHSYQGTFLPQVWEQLPDAKLFLEHLSMKAGSDPSIYEQHPQIYTYNVEAIEKQFDDIEPL